MARLLSYHSASSGNTFPAIDMLLELRRRGHEVHVRSRASDVDQFGALGLHSAPVDPRIEQIEVDDWRGRSQVDSFLRLLRSYYAWAKLEIPDLRQAIAEVRPDALIVDSNCMGATYVAEASGLPWALYCAYPRHSAPMTFLPTDWGSVPRADRWGRRVTACCERWVIGWSHQSC